MAATPESKVKKQVLKTLKEHGAYVMSVVKQGYGNNGEPDIVACYKGRFIGIECKAGLGVVTALQRKNLDAINLAGGKAWIVNEGNVNFLPELLSSL